MLLRKPFKFKQLLLTVALNILLCYLLVVYLFSSTSSQYEYIETSSDSKLSSSAGSVPKLVKIPRVIHQTNVNSNIPKNLAPLQETWMKKNPGYYYTLWTKVTSKHYLRTEFSHLVKHYKLYDLSLEILRYLILFKHGGIYADLSVECARPMDELLSNEGDNDIILGTLQDGSLPINFMASKPNHPFWLACIDEIIQGLETCTSNNCIYGSEMLTRVLQRYSHKNIKLALLPPSKIYPISPPNAPQMCISSSSSEEFNPKRCKSELIPLSHKPYTVTYWKKYTTTPRIDFEVCRDNDCYRDKFVQMLESHRNSLPPPQSITQTELSSSVQQEPSCYSKLKIYVYPVHNGFINSDISQWGKNYLCPRELHCLGTQFSLTLYAHQFFLTSCLRTLNPLEADFFYFPFYALAANNTHKVLFQDTVSNMTAMKEPGFKAWEELTGLSSEWWRRKSGKDHLLVSNIGGWKWGDFDLMERIKSIWLTLEVLETQRTDKELMKRVMVVPYPSENIPFVPIRNSYNLDPKLDKKGKRDILFFAAYHEKKGRVVRQALLNMTNTTPESKFLTKFTQTNWQHYLYRSMYCPCPIGDTLSTRRFFNAVLAGCVPIVISDNLLLPWEYDDRMEYDFIIRILEKDVAENPNILLDKIKKFDLKYAQKRMREIRERFVYKNGEDWDTGAWGLIVDQLESLVRNRKQ